MDRNEEFLCLLQYGEKELDRVIADLSHAENRNVNVRVAIKKLVELSNEFNCRIQCLKRG